MKTFFNLLTSLLLIVAIIYSGNYIYSLLTNPCQIPISIYIADLDSRFGISKDLAQNALNEAVSDWESKSNMDLFKISQDNKAVEVYFKYDERQANTSKLNDLGGDIDAERANYEAIKNEYEIKKAQYESAKDEYDRDPSQARASRVNELVGELNALAEHLNSLARNTNEVVDEYNDVQNNLQNEFDQGNFISDGINKNIYIYQFGDEEELLKVLTHELGHALGLEHSKSEDSVMYYQSNRANAQEILSSDITSLRETCKI